MAVNDSPVSTTTSLEFRIASADGLQIACARWNSRCPVRGVVQIAHGMGEYIGRYTGLIDALASAGLTVYANDHRGHGRSAPSATYLGNLGEGGFDLLVEDMVRLSRVAKYQNPGVPFLLLGHSMGSFAAQQYIIDHSKELDGLILSGSGALDALAFLASHMPPEINFLNIHFEPARTPLDWLTSDSAVVDAFISDPLCFPQLEPASLASFLAAAPRLADPFSLRKIRSDLPICLLSGSEDPIGQRLEGVEILIARYLKAGVNKISRRYYAWGRHEMLNELNREQVRADILNWISGVLERKRGSLVDGAAGAWSLHAGG